MPAHAKDLTGQRFTRLVAIKIIGKNKQGRMVWEVKCDCGNTHFATVSHLLEGQTKSCGCLTKERLTVHGDYYSPEHRAWLQLKSRCNNPNNKKYPIYGGRGIIVCAEWNKSYTKFLEDMGRKPSDKHQLDRIDTNGNYCKENCRWVTIDIQARNRRSNIFITYNGVTKCIQDWADHFGITFSSLKYRYKKFITNPNYMIFEGLTSKKEVSRIESTDNKISL